MYFEPIIKWSGSKRSQSEQIISFFPREIDTYYEPFVGGGSVMFQLLHSDVQVNHIVCSDSNPHLIGLWNVIKENPNALWSHYKQQWEELKAFPSTYYGIECKKRYFNEVRRYFNVIQDPMDFFFLLRTTTNGLVRFNQKGQFNNSFHVTRNGIHPDRLKPILMQWAEMLYKRNVTFICRDYSVIQSKPEDFLYLDPPYAQTKGMYYGGIDLEKLWEWMGKQEGGYALSFDGMCDDEDLTYDVPIHLHDIHLYIPSGVSSFRRIVNKEVRQIRESLYLRYSATPSQNNATKY